MSISIPGYDVEELLGRGTTGEVWAGRDRRSGVRVALKRVDISLASADRAARAEAALLAALEHPSLVRFEQFISCKGFAVLVLELAAGGSMAELLARRGRLSIDEVGVSMSDIGSALAYAHGEGVLHGDLSASNVLYTAQGRSKLADLGLARMLGTESSWIGTPAYIDPVVAAGGAFGAASDVFGLAAVALHAFTGAGPWAAAGAAAEDVLDYAASYGEVPDLDERLRELPSTIATAMTRAMDPVPARRGTAAEFALDLRAAVSPIPVVLAAGRVPTAPGRHYADRVRDDSAGADSDVAVGAAAQSSLARPEFRRPADLTHISRPQIRQLLVTPPSPRQRTASWLARRRPLIVAGTLAVGVVTVLCIAGPRMAGALTHRDNAERQPVTAPTASIELPPSGSPPATATPAAHPRTESVDQLLRTQNVLQAVDDRRSLAYARREPAGMSAVYSSPALLAQDTAQLLSAAPAGCHIDGMHGSYRDILITEFTSSRIVLSADVSISSASLVCAQVTRGTVVATRPVRMSITLAASGQSDFEIASQRAVSG